MHEGRKGGLGAGVVGPGGGLAGSHMVWEKN